MTEPRLTFSETGEGPPLVLLMGLGAPAEAWRPHIDSWSSSFRCIAVDNPGVAGSQTAPLGLTTRSIAERVADLLDELSITSCTVAGISMGACVTLELADLRPRLIERMILVSPWARTDPYTRSVLEVLRMVRATGQARLFNEVLRNTVWTAGWINAHEEQMQPNLVAPFALTAEAFTRQALACAAHDVLDRLPRITSPTLVTLGTQDTFIRPDLSVEVASVLPNAIVERYTSGHVHHWEELERFNSHTKDWLLN